MNKINWKVRFKNPIFIFQILLAILTPILAYVGLSFADVTSWGTVLDLLSQAYTNPYLLVLVIVSVFNTVTDPTTKGLKDTERAMSYDMPNYDVDEFDEFDKD